MAKKIYDIKPPKVAKKVENTIKELSVPAVKTTKKRTRKAAVPAPVKYEAPVMTPQPEIRSNRVSKQRFSFGGRKILIGSGILVLLVGIWLYNVLQKATIEISPSMQELSFQEKILVDKSIIEINLATKVIPAQLVEIEKEKQQEFPSTGSSSTDSKATGSITIYNKVEPAAPVTLLKGTHFLSDSGKYFITLEKITIPAAKSKTTPGSITVKVQAEQVGSDSNIGPSKFSVPKLTGTAYYYAIYAESSSKMIGGSTGKVKKVTADDIGEAEEALTQGLFEDAENSLRSNLSENDILLDGAVAKKVIESSSSDEAGAVVDNFTQSVKIKISALVFKKDDLDRFVREYIASKIESDEKILEESLNIEYTSDIINLEKGTETVALKFSTKTYHGIDEASLVSSLKGKSSSEIESTISERYGDNISSIKVNLWPFWVSKAPNSDNKIKIKLNFE